VTARVESPAGSGAPMKSHLTCDVTLEDGAREWTLVGLTFSNKPPVATTAGADSIADINAID